MPIFKQMDLDAYSAAHRDEWDRLAALGSKGRFSGSESDELIDRYQSGASQLSAIATTSGQSIQGDRLSVYLSRARLRFTGASANVLSQLPTFFLGQLPAALFRIRWLSLVVTVVALGVALVYYLWGMSDPQVVASLGPASALKEYAEQDFVNYYSDHSGVSFASVVWTNNAWIAAQCIAFGIVGVYAPAVLLSNVQQLGLIAALMDQYGRFDVFLLYIAPHGQLELYSVFVSCAAGMRIFWSWIAPGARTRAQALAQDGRALFTVAIGLTLSLFVSGIIEGFVTRQDWPWPIKIGIGTLALGGFLFYQWGVGRRAFRAGQTGDLEEFESGAKQLVAG